MIIHNRYYHHVIRELRKLSFVDLEKFLYKLYDTDIKFYNFLTKNYCLGGIKLIEYLESTAYKANYNYNPLILLANWDLVDNSRAENIVYRNAKLNIDNYGYIECYGTYKKYKFGIGLAKYNELTLYSYPKVIIPEFRVRREGFDMYPWITNLYEFNSIRSGRYVD